MRSRAMPALVLALLAAAPAPASADPAAPCDPRDIPGTPVPATCTQILEGAEGAYRVEATVVTPHDGEAPASAGGMVRLAEIWSKLIALDGTRQEMRVRVPIDVSDFREETKHPEPQPYVFGSTYAGIEVDVYAGRLGTSDWSLLDYRSMLLTGNGHTEIEFHVRLPAGATDMVVRHQLLAGATLLNLGPAARTVDVPRRLTIERVPFVCTPLRCFGGQPLPVSVDEPLPVPDAVPDPYLGPVVGKRSISFSVQTSLKID